MNEKKQTYGGYTISGSEPVIKNYLGFEDTVKEMLCHFHAGMFPYHFGDEFGKGCEYSDVSDKTEKEYARAAGCFFKALKYISPYEMMNHEYTETLIAKLPYIKEVIITDIRAAYEGDPAAVSEDEVILSYPAFKAISTYRIAHEIYLMKIPVIPRIMSEYMHSITGIDIHPGAAIGRYFFIDHGTGVVIGETTTIGCHVKLYQHVTLGAKSFEVGEDGVLVKGIKRHPDIGDRVVIYAGATILGGTTRIGHDSVIGGNTWLTHSVEPGSHISIKVFDSKVTKI